MSKKPLILVVNDDSIYAPGIRSLIKVMNDFGEVVVVAPKNPQSGMSHAISLNNPLIYDKVIIDNGPQIEYSCNGTPSDCVKIAFNKILTRKPDLCVSGINHGSNSSINVIYSGTMAAALEASIAGVPSMGFSLLNYSSDAEFSLSEKVARIIVSNFFKNLLPKDICLNVNIPNIPVNKFNGIKICRQAKANWIEEFDERKNPSGKTYYWLTGKFINNDDKNDTDEWALTNNYVSIVPVKYDLTDYNFISKLELLNNAK
mgnify:FL=1